MISKLFNITLLCTVLHHNMVCGLQKAAPLPAMQQNVVVPAPSTNYLRTLSSWATSHIPALLAATGAVGTGYIFLKYGKQWLTRWQKSASTPMAPTLPDVAKKSLSKAQVYEQLSPQLASPQPEAEIVQKPLAQEHFQEKIRVWHQEHPDITPSQSDLNTLYREGYQVFHQMMSGHTTQPTLSHIRSLLWFLYLEAVATKTEYNFFKEGTFKFIGTEEQINALYQALMHAEKTPYTRMASHYNEHFKFPAAPALYNPFGWWNYAQEITNYLYSHKGLDLIGLPPFDMHTILFARLEPNQLYIKPEQHGTADMSDKVQHTLDYIKSLARKNLPASTLQFLNQFMTMTPDDAAEFKKERVPAQVYDKALELIKEAAAALGEQETIALHKTTMKTWGIQQIIPRLALYEANATLKEKDPKVQARISAYLQQLMKEYTDWQYRKGNEIIFKIDDLLAAPALV